MARPLDMPVKAPLLLLSTANRNDRFKLLEDDSILAPNINNSIHPIFSPSNFENATPEMYRDLQRALRLSSLFLKYDTVLEWFAAPLLGLPLLDSASGKSYLSDPLANKSTKEKKVLIDRVRKALECLAHSVRFDFLTADAKFYARTLLDGRPAKHQVTCTQHFTWKRSVRIEFRKQTRDFLLEHIQTSSLCDRLRYYFSFAVTLVHELTHAVGVMRRGDLNEGTHIRLDHPSKPEFGYAWENFMFGGIINPFDKESSKVPELMRKVWGDDLQAYASGGKEWSAVPIACIAQWFQKGTWDLIKLRGPTAIAPPKVHLKVRQDRHHYHVLSDNQDALDDVKALQQKMDAQYAINSSCPRGLVPVLHAKIAYIDTDELQNYILPQPPRVPPKPKPYFAGTPAGVAKPWKAIGDLMIRSYSVPPQASPTLTPHIARPHQFLPRSETPSSGTSTAISTSGKRCADVHVDKRGVSGKRAKCSDGWKYSVE